MKYLKKRVLYLVDFCYFSKNKKFFSLKKDGFLKGTKKSEKKEFVYTLFVFHNFPSKSFLSMAIA